MAVRRNTASKQGRKQAGKRSAKTNRSNSRSYAGARFFKAVCLSAITSFLAFSHVLHPGGLEQMAAEWLDVGRANVRGAAPVLETASHDAYAQTAFASCPHFFPAQKPVVPAAPALRELCFSAFAILHDGRHKTPVFVAQRLNRRMLSAARDVSRTDRFYAEARLPQAERADLADYRGSGYSRGHMAPAGDMSNADAMAQSFSLANMVPQNQTHNAGAWSKVESDTRKYVMRASGDVYVFTGPIYGADTQTIGSGRVAVPTHLYKLVYDAANGRSWVHWQANQADAQVGPPISYAEFVRRTGLQLLPGPTLGG